MTIAANLFMFFLVILMFNKIRKWRGDEENYHHKVKNLKQSKLKMTDLNTSKSAKYEEDS